MPDEKTDEKENNGAGVIALILVFLAYWALGRFLKRHPKLVKAISAVLVIILSVGIIQSIAENGFYGYKEKFDAFAGHSQGTYLVFLTLMLLLFLMLAIGIFTPCKHCLKWNLIHKKEEHFCKNCSAQLEPALFEG